MRVGGKFFELPSEVRETARAWNFDAYIAATLAPASQQRHLIALAAFVGEMEKILYTVSEPALAQIRVQWWRDELQRMESEQHSNHPIGAALVCAMTENDWPIGLLMGVTDAFADQLSEPRLDDDQALLAWISKRFTAPIELALTSDECVPESRLVASVGRAYGLAVVCRMIANEQAATGNETRFAQTSRELETRALALHAQHVSAVSALPRRSRVGALPFALVPVYADLKRDAPGRLTKIWRMGRAHWLGRF